MVACTVCACRPYRDVSCGRAVYHMYGGMLRTAAFTSSVLSFWSFCTALLACNASDWGGGGGGGGVRGGRGSRNAPRHRSLPTNTKNSTPTPRVQRTYHQQPQCVILGRECTARRARPVPFRATAPPRTWAACLFFPFVAEARALALELLMARDPPARPPSSSTEGSRKNPTWGNHRQRGKEGCWGISPTRQLTHPSNTATSAAVLRKCCVSE